MAGRHKSRILAMQFLFSQDINQSWGEFAEKQSAFCDKYSITEEAFPHFFALIRGVIGQRPQLDALISEHSENWKLSRMSGVDRNILRIAVFEMINCDDVPPKVAINEAIELGKRFGSDDSGAFINGVLDNIHKNMKQNTEKITANTNQ